MDIYRSVAYFILGACVQLAHFKCVSRDYGNGGTVCVCDDKQCDTLEPIKPVKYPHVLVYTSNLAGLRFQKSTEKFQNSTDDTADAPDVSVNAEQTYQKIVGFGGAFTDATGINIGSLTDDAKENLMRSYFTRDGLEYNLCRIPVGGTDFSEEAYSYDDGEPDPALKRFALHRADLEYKIPYIKVAQNLSNGKLQFFASNWAAPKWMKTNEKYVGGTLKPEMYQSWADYFVKFYDAYKQHGIKFWGMTTGNEPSLAKFPFVTFASIASIGWTSRTLATWVGENLGPTLRKHGYGYINIMALDDQRYYVPWFIDLMFKDSERAKNYTNGTAVHWYWDKVFPASLLTMLHNKYPDKFIISTEACSGFFLGRGVRLGSWSRGEDYAQDIIEDLQNWVVGWVDWNMALNTGGGPTYINNTVDSPIVVNATANEFYKQPMYYALGHFSKFLPKNSIRIDTTDTKKVRLVAFKRPDKGVAIVILNQRKSVQSVTIQDETKGQFTLNISAHSITSVVYW